MTTRDDVLAKATKALSEGADALPSSTPSREARARAVGAMEAALRARAARKRRNAWLGRAAIAAVLALGTFGGVRLYSILHARGRVDPPASPTITAVGHGAGHAFHDGAPVPFDGASIASGDRVTTANAPASIALSTGTTLDLAPSADVTFAQSNGVQRFELATGGVLAHVAKLHDGERFLVRTRDVEVEVRGTVFEVSVVPGDPACGAGTPTRVKVDEGVVVVRTESAETRVAAGESWPAGCAVAAAPTAPTIPSPIDLPSSASTTIVKKPLLVPSTAPVASTSISAPDALAAKNDLFAAALAAERRGELGNALAKYDAYLAAYPNGELAENASAEKMRILAKIDPSHASAAARDYLARWPNGFAAEEADAIVAPPPAPSASNLP